MIHKTEGIVLNHIRYGESGAIVRIYTRLYGLQSYMVNGVYGKRRKNNIVLMQALNRLELDVYHHSNKDIQRIKEFRISAPLQRIPYSQTRRAQAFLLTELLWRILRNEGPAPDVYAFLEASILRLDSEQEGLENFHLWFLFQLARYLGFQPHDNYSEAFCWFDLSEGCFVNREPAHAHYLKRDLSLRIHQIGHLGLDELSAISKRLDERRSLLDALLLYYELHHPGLGQLRSLAVLKELFQ